MVNLSPADETCKTLAVMEPQFKMALPPQIQSMKFLRVAQTAIRQNPKLVECERNSLYASLLKCAADGLLPDGREAAIVPFGSSAQYMPMIAGILKKARNSGEIKTVNAQIVYKNDGYEHWIDEQGEHFKHVPARGERGDIMLVYAFAQTNDGGVFFEEMDMAQIQAVEKMSKQSNGPWKGPFKTEMMRKSALRRLLKYRVPSSTDLDDLIRQDDPMYEQPEDKKPAEPTSSRLRDAIETKAEPNGQPGIPGPTAAQEAQEQTVAAGADREIPL